MNKKNILLLGFLGIISSLSAASIQQIGNQLSSATTQKAFVLGLQSLLKAQQAAQTANNASDLKAVKDIINSAYNRYFKLFPSRDDKFPMGSDGSLLDPAKVQTLVAKYVPDAGASDSSGTGQPVAPALTSGRQAPPARPIGSQTPASTPAQSSSNWWSTLIDSISQTPTYPTPPRPQVATQSNESIAELTAQLSKFSAKDLAITLRDVSRATSVPQPTLSLSQTATMGLFLNGLYRALDTLDAVFDDLVKRGLGNSVPMLNRYLLMRLSKTAGKLAS